MRTRELVWSLGIPFETRVMQLKGDECHERSGSFGANNRSVYEGYPSVSDEGYRDVQRVVAQISDSYFSRS